MENSSISNRNGHLIIGRHAVPVREVADSICDRMDIEWLTARYPLVKEEIMDCMDCVADIDKLSGLLFIPYVLWLFFASYLNLFIVFNN